MRVSYAHHSAAVLAFILAILLASLNCASGAGVGTEDHPAESCMDLLDMGGFPSGNYWLQPSGHGKFKGYCDMDSFGGGWLMCYTTDDKVHISRETSSPEQYPSIGYRSDCRDYPFNNVMFVKQSVSPAEKVWFQFNGFGTMVASGGGYRGNVNATWASSDDEFGYTWSGKGGATFRSKECRDARDAIRTGGYAQSTVNAQCSANQFHELLICDNLESEVSGFPPSHFGFAALEKRSECPNASSCDDPCRSDTALWYRASSGLTGLSGTFHFHALSAFFLSLISSHHGCRPSAMQDTMTDPKMLFLLASERAKLFHAESAFNSEIVQLSALNEGVKASKL